MALGRPNKWMRILIPTVLVLAWLGVSAVGGPYFGRIEEVSEVDLTAFLPESAEATKVSKKLEAFQTDNTLPAVSVFEAQSGTLTDKEIQRIEAVGDRFEKSRGIVGEVSPPVLADDEKAALVLVNIDADESIEEAVSGLRSEIQRADLTGIQAHVSGPAGFAADLNVAFAGIDGILLLTALAVVFVILIIVYRSILLPIVVLCTSVIALSASILVVFSLAKAGAIQLNGQVQGILFILVIGAGTDYSLLFVSRFREALYQQKQVYDAIIASLKGAFEPILASGGTVIVGLLCLLLSDLASNKALGPVGSIGIAMAMLSALTFLPAALLLLGRASFWPAVPRANVAARRSHARKIERGIWHKTGEVVKKYPRRLWVGTTAILLLFAAFAPQLEADGVSQSDLILGYSEAREGQEAIARHFPDGSGTPASVIVPRDKLDGAVDTIESTTGTGDIVAAADGGPNDTAPLGIARTDIESEIAEEAEDDLETARAKIEAQATVIARQAGPQAAKQFKTLALKQIPKVDEIVEEAYPFKDAKIRVVNDEVLLRVTLADDPASDEAKATIERLRAKLATVDQNILVGGPTAAQLDTNTASIRDRAIIIPVVLVAITLILMLLLRAVVAPILLLATTVISFASSLGVAALLFNNVWNFPGVDPSVVLYGFVFLVALGIDYNIFLMTRVREESLKMGTAKGVIKGLVVTGGVITSAGIVLAATFAALGVIPILFLFQLAFIVAFGVLLDTFIVRSILVPALIRDIGPFVWWPSKLRKKQ